MLGVDIMIQVKNPFRPRLKIIDFDVGIGEQDSCQGFLLLQMIVKRTDGVELIPLSQRIRRVKKDKLSIRMILNVGENIVFDVQQRLLGKLGGR